MTLRKATILEQPIIWGIIQDAIEQRRKDGSLQWQEGYPNEQTIQDDIDNGYGYVVVQDDVVMAYAAVIFGIEPAYTDIIGRWLTDGDYVVIHRVATSDAAKGKGVATQLFKLLEDLCIEKKVQSIKVDTNFDNVPMLRIVEKLGYTYCGEIFLRGNARRAYEKVVF